MNQSEKREEKVQYLDPSKSVSLRDINKGLKKAATDIDSISRKGNRVNESELRNLLESSIVSKEPDYESDLRKHATLFYENAYAMLKHTLGDFYQKEVIGKLRETADRLHAKHEKISFPVDQTRINGDVAAIVKTVEKTVQEVLDKSLCEDETLRVYIQRSLLPSWKKTLDHIYETFDATLKHELNHYISLMPRYDRSESETLAQLDRISWAIDELARCQDDARSRFMAMSSKIENELCQAVGNMYMRREQSER